MRVWGIKHARLLNLVFHHWGRNGSMYIGGKKGKHICRKSFVIV